MERNPPARVLKLLALLQGRREWSGAELAARLGMSRRTLRRDMERLRSLGYAIEAVAGRVGGYRMTSSDHLPPLLFEEEEAVVIAVSLLQTAAHDPDIRDTALSALAKLQSLLPEPAQRRVSALLNTTHSWGEPLQASASLQTLGRLSAACRDAEIIRFTYTKANGASSARRVEPHQLVSLYRYWHLVACDTDAGDWRSFRVDRMTEVRTTRQRFVPRELPAEHALAFVVTAIRDASYPYQGRVIIHESAEVIQARLRGVLPGRLQPLGQDRCALTLGSHSLEPLAQMLLMLEADFELEGSEELRAYLLKVGKRFLRLRGQ